MLSLAADVILLFGAKIRHVPGILTRDQKLRDNSDQKGRVETCLRFFKFALDRERVTCADSGWDVVGATLQRAAVTWVQGDTVALEGCLRGKSLKEVEDIEDKAVVMLRQ